MKHRHAYDRDGTCTKCGHDGPSVEWELRNLRCEIGDDEYFARKEAGEFDFHIYCSMQQELTCSEQKFVDLLVKAMLSIRSGEWAYSKNENRVCRIFNNPDSRAHLKAIETHLKELLG